VTEPHDWPAEQSARGTLRRFHDTVVGYLAVLFEDPEEARRAQHALQEQGVPENDLRRYDAETLRIAARLQRNGPSWPRRSTKWWSTTRCGNAG
jgi:hypothetical protein